MNHRILFVLFAFGAPALAPAAEGSASQPSPVQAQPATPPSKVPPSIAAPPKEMTAFLRRDGHESRAALFSKEAETLVVAKVDDAPITLQQLTNALGMAHRSAHEGPAKQHDFAPVLDRLVEIKLCVAEAREMGLDELPEVKKAIQAEEESRLIGLVRAEAVKDARADPALARRLYQDEVREWKVRSLLFPAEADARAFLASVKGGKGSFEKLGRQRLADKQATGSVEGDFAGAPAMLPQVTAFVAKAKPGAPGIVKVARGWSVIEVLGTRYPENAEVRARVEERALEAARQRAATRYYDALERKYARIDQRLLKRLDFEAPKPGFEALRKDQRPVATIQGEAPFTVGDLANGVEMKFFHGVDSPIKERRVNVAKVPALKTLLRRRLVLKEARRLNLAQSEGHRRYMAEFTEATLFSAYLERAIMPDVKVTEQEGQEYYAKHKADFTTPAMYRLEGVAFGNAKDAQSALEKLRGGTDFKWLRANATGQVKDDDRAVQLEGGVLSANALPEELRAQLSGAKQGDYRLSELSGQFFVVRVASATAPSEQPYSSARAAISKKLIGENLQKALKDATAKLRKHHTIDVYLTRIGY